MGIEEKMGEVDPTMSVEDKELHTEKLRMGELQRSNSASNFGSLKPIRNWERPSRNRAP